MILFLWQLDPDDINNRSILVQVLVVQERYDEAIGELQKAMEFFSRSGNEAAALKFRQDMEQIKLKKSQQK